MDIEQIHILHAQPLQRPIHRVPVLIKVLQKLYREAVAFPL